MNWKKTITTIVVGGFLFFLLKKPLEALITSTLVEKVFDKIQVDAWTNWAFLILILFLAVLWLIKLSRRFVPSTKFTFILIIVTLLYAFYRWIDHVWYWIPLHGSETIYYADLIFLILPGQAALHLCVFIHSKKFVNRKQELFALKLRKEEEVEAPKHEGFFCDEPVEDEDDDILDFKSYAERLAKRILKTDSKRSFAIGVNAKWGHGKTSFMTFLKRKIGNSIIEVNFDPWNSQNPESIIADFFENFDQALSPYSGSISRKLNRYAQRLSGKGFNSLASAIIGGLRLFSSIETIDDIRKSIQKDLIRINRKIVVYIDDLDRLDQKEIVEVIRLIRNTADFQNTTFIVAYDREYIVQAIKGINEHDSRMFLEKIFQHEVNLPYYDKSVLRQELFALINKCIDDEAERDNIREVILGKSHSRSKYLDNWLTNLRDVSRLANSILSNYFDVEDELIFDELLRLELIRIKYPFLYVRLISETDVYFQQGTGTDLNAVMQLRIESQKSDSELTNGDPAIEKVIYNFLYKNRKQYQIGVHEIDRIMDLLGNLFPDRHGNWNLVPTSYLSIRNPQRFDQYFSYDLLKGRLPEGEFKRAFNSGDNAFINAIDSFVSNGLEQPLIKRITVINKFTSRQEFERVIKGVFHLSRLKSKRAEYTANSLIQYPASDLYNKIFMSDSKVRQLYGNEENYKEFLVNQLNQAQIPYAMESNLLDYAKRHLWNEYIFSADELFKYSMKFLKNYLNETDKLDITGWHLYHDAVQYRKEDASGGGYTRERYYPKEARVFMKKFISQKAIDDFILATVDPNMREESLFTVSKGALNIFDDWNDLESFMKENSAAGNYVAEFLLFFGACKKVSFKQYISFDFKIIPIEEKHNDQ